MHKDKTGQFLVLVAEEPYREQNNSVVLGYADCFPPLADPVHVNRYLIAGLDIQPNFVDEALWRVCEDALEQLFTSLHSEFDIFGYQCNGFADRVLKLGLGDLLYVERASRSMEMWGKPVTLRMDRYLVQVRPESFSSFCMHYGEETWFRYYLIKPKGIGIGPDEFQELNAAFARERLNDLNPATMAAFLDRYAAMLWYVCSPRGRDIDGPHLGICTKESWRSKLFDLLEPDVDPCVKVCLDLTAESRETAYCLDIVRPEYLQT